MYAEIKVRVYFNKSEMSEIGVTPKEVLGSLKVLDNDSIDELCVVPSPLLMPETWDVVSGPYLIGGGSIEERKLVTEVADEEIP